MTTSGTRPTSRPGPRPVARPAAAGAQSDRDAGSAAAATRTDRDGGPAVGVATPTPVILPPEHRRPTRTKALVRLPVGWPVVAFLAGFPIWWALGLALFIYPLLAVPMVVHLWRRRPVKLPPGFGIWLLFLLWQVFSIAALGLNPPGTVPETAANRMIAYGVRAVVYVSVTVMLIYVGNLTDAELPRRRLIRLMAWMFVVTAIGGLAGIIAPQFNFTSPTELLLPGSIRGNSYVQSLIHPAFSQVQAVLGYSSPRPKAPFEYTNAWGNNFSIFLVWLVVLAASGDLIRRAANRWFAVAALVMVGAVPAILSLNRGMWIGVGFAVFYVTARLALRRHFVPLAAMVAGVAVLFLVIAVSPLHSVISQRLAHGHSNQIRETNTSDSFALTNKSPIIGYGSTRIKQGSSETIAVGRSARCPQCGNLNIGSNGQIWLALVGSGYVGTALYVGFFLYLLWRYRRDATPIGLAGSIVVWFVLIYSITYDAFASPLVFYFLSIALLWRNDLDRHARVARRAELEAATAARIGARPAPEPAAVMP